MSPSGFRRRAGLVAAAFVAGAPLLATGAAYGEPVASGSEVVFNGSGLLGVSCGAKPNRTSVTIPAETTLRVVNRTRFRATLLLDGSARGEIAKGGAAAVLFHRGPVTLGLKPHCVVAEESTVRVQVITERPAVPAPVGPTTPGTPAAGAGRTPAGSPPGTAHGTTTGRQATTQAPGARPPGTTARQPDGTATQPNSAGIVADGTAAPDLGDVPDAASGAGADLAAEPVMVEPLSNHGSNGLLAVIAALCVIGVSVGAIRVILAQRASRASVA